MPKCEHCKYLANDSCEYPEHYCELFGVEPGSYPSQDSKMFTEGGCKYHWNTLEKMYDIQQEKIDRHYESYIDFCQNKEL